MKIYDIFIYILWYIYMKMMLSELKLYYKVVHFDIFYNFVYYDKLWKYNPEYIYKLKLKYHIFISIEDCIFEFCHNI